LRRSAQPRNLSTGTALSAPRHGDLIQLTRKGLAFSGSAADLRSLRAQFHRDHYIILPRLIEPDLFQTILNRIEAAPFRDKEFNGVVRQSVMDDPITYNLLMFLVNMPGFHRLIQRITGCRRIADFRGRIYRLNPSTDDRIVWHSDACDHRMVTLSMNLTTQEYRGGTLQIRCRGSKDLLHEVRNTGLGDTLLMRVTAKLVHRVLPVEGDVPRTAFAGWFRWEKGDQDYHSAMRKAAHVSADAQEIRSAESTVRSVAHAD